MFLQLVTPTTVDPAAAQRNTDSLFIYHPLQISAIVETAWRNRYNAANSRFVPWPEFVTGQLLTNAFIQGWNFPKVGPPTQIEQEFGIMPTAEPFTPPANQPGILAPGGIVRPLNW